MNVSATTIAAETTVLSVPHFEAAEVSFESVGVTDDVGIVQVSDTMAGE